MRRTSPSTLTLLVCLLPLAGASCSLAAKAGIKVNGKPVGATEPRAESSTASGAAATRSNESPAAKSKAAPASSPFAKSVAPPAPVVNDSVPAIPATLVVAAAEGKPTISLASATWCEGVKGLEWDTNTERRFGQAMKKVGDLHKSGLDQMSKMARFACGGTQSADRMSWVQSYMQAQANQIGISQEHLTHLMGVTAQLTGFDLDRFANHPPESCESFKAKKNANRLVQEEAFLKRVGMGCADPSSADWMQWWVDRGTSLDSQVALLGWLNAVYGYSARTVSLSRGIMGVRDAGKFDQAAYFSELQKMGADDKLVAKSILRFYDTKSRLLAWRAHHSEELGADFEQVVKSYNDAYDAWEAAYKTDKAAVDFAFGIEAAKLEGDKRLFEGCSEKGQNFAKSYVMRHQPKSIEDFERIASQPIGTLILAAAYECEQALDRPLMASVYGAMLEKAPVARGPRFAAKLAAARSVGEIQAVKSRFPVRARDFQNHVPNDAFGRGRKGYFDTAAGTIARVETKGDMATLHFKKDSWKEPVYKCRETNRIDRIDDNGKLVYRKICKQTGTKKMSSQEEPITIPAAAAGGIAKGRFVVALRNKKQPSEGLPQQVYDNKERKTLINYFGLQLR